jgi:hypothetical protein
MPLYRMKPTMIIMIDAHIVVISIKYERIAISLRIFHVKCELR